jgi:hypothetical protein
LFDETPNSQRAADLRPFFQERHGRTISIAGEEWWVDGLVQLQGQLISNPADLYRGPGMLAFVWSRTGLRVGRKFTKAEWIQGTVWITKVGETVGSMVWHYSSGAIERAPLTYGRSTARFWGDLPQIESEKGFPEPVWKHHESAEAVGKERWLRLYQQTWTNPRPGETVDSVDFVSNSQSPAAPFLIAVKLLP